MAKTNMIMREHRRARVAKKYATKRAQLKELIRSPKSTPEQRAAAQAALQQQPRDASKSRPRSRCAITGRSPADPHPPRPGRAQGQRLGRVFEAEDGDSQGAEGRGLYRRLRPRAG